MKKWLVAGCLASLAVMPAAEAVTPSVSVRANHAVALRNDGTVVAMGDNSSAQLGMGQSLAATPQQVASVGQVKSAAAGKTFAVALKPDGSVWTWGDNQYGQLGDGTIFSRSKPLAIGSLSGITGIAAGWYHTLALKGDGTVWAWGYDSSGQLGTGSPTTFPVTKPVQVGGLADVAQLAAGVNHSIALKKDGTVWAWGGNQIGQLGDSSKTDRSGPVAVSGLSGITAIAAAGFVSIALKQDGSVWFWGGGLPLSRAEGLSNAVAVAAGNSFFVALKQDGSVWTWGLNHNGTLGDGTASASPSWRMTPAQVSGLQDIQGIAVGYEQVLALRRDGTVWAWGGDDYGQLGDGANAARGTPAAVAGLGGITVVAAGVDHSFALKQDGGLIFWGYSANGELGKEQSTSQSVPVPVNGLTGITAISAGVFHTLGLAQDGNVWAWGNNTSGQLGDASTTTRSSPVKVSGLTDVSAISAGNAHSVALKRDGSVWAWGDNQYGQYGTAVAKTVGIPVQVAGLSGIAAIAAGSQHTLALKQDGSVWAWGDNQYGQLGTSTAAGTPAQVPGLDKVLAIAAGDTHSLALRQDGSVWGWGSNAWGQLGSLPAIAATPQPIAGLAGITAIATGQIHSLALAQDGSVWMFGYTFLRTPIPVFGLSKAMAITAGGGGNSMVVAEDGTVWSWGTNAYGQHGDGTYALHLLPAPAVNVGADGYLDLIPEIPNKSIGSAAPPFLIKVEKSSLVQTTLNFDSGALGKSGNVYVTAFLKANSPLLSQGRVQGFAAAADDVVPVMLTRNGFKQMGAGVPADPVYSGPLDARNNTFSMYNPANFDNTKDYGIFCVGYATDVGAPSAKGQLRAAVTGQIGAAYQCPPIQINATSAFTATSNDRSEALTLNAAIAPRSEDIGKTMNIYTWAVVPNGSFFVKKPGGWDAMSALQLDANFTATLTANVAVPLVDNLDLRSLAGTQAFVGYGSSAKDMLDNARYGLVYTIK